MNISGQRFPSFDDWDQKKLEFLNSGSIKQRQKFYETHEKDGENFVIVDYDLCETMKYKCKYCSERLQMDFNQEIEEWVFTKARKLLGFPVHESCFEDALRRYPSKKFDKDVFCYTNYVLEEN